MAQNDTPPFDRSRGFKFTQTPNPQWTYGQQLDATPEGRAWLEGKKDGWKVVDTEKEDPMKLYALMTSGIVPRPIAFVSTISEDGVENLSPFSWFNMVRLRDRPVFVFVFVWLPRARPARVKDTAANIAATRQFTVNIISEPWVEAANACAVDAPAEVGEWPLSGLTKAASLHVKPARVQESAFSMECELHQTVEIVHPVTGVNTTTMILGLVKYVHVRNDMLTARGTVDPARLRPVARLGDISYARVGDGFRLRRPVWADEAEAIRAAAEGANE
ncbi:hypothetical protein IEO21_07643 [Rhodonia placenta]|uniref:Flavin reductase like domain-containing protein n=1 Tax=Rhodonia placenta TaxID=104341 RepID=A0A8H7NY57_9APHY|nr:hypothetical protein IEO21_07643 [Postia placenta]